MGSFLLLKGDVAAILKYALGQGFQIHPTALQMLEKLESDDLGTILKYIIKKKRANKEYLIVGEDIRAFLGVDVDDRGVGVVKVLFDPTSMITTAEGVAGYTSLFASRYAKMKRLIKERPQFKKLKTVSAASKIAGVDNDVFVCGLVTRKESERSFVKLTLEDPTGSMDVVVYDDSLREEAKVLLVDQFVTVRVGKTKSNKKVVKELSLPGIPSRVPNRSETESFAVFLSDLHIGSRFFMEESFLEFVEWLSGSDPVARRVDFVVVGGDLVDGVGICPNQDKELVCQTVEEQLQKAEGLLAKIPSHMQVIISPGNHDPGRRALPQPAIPKKYGGGFWSRSNFVMVGNPSVISLNGVRVLIFHGQSIDDIVKTTPGLSYDKPVDVMRYLLKARHLSPIYGNLTPIAPESEDLLVIDDVPDVFHVGHVHVVALEVFRGTLLINSGTFQSQTPFQAGVGLEPTPCLVPIVNLKTFEVRMISFN